MVKKKDLYMAMPTELFNSKSEYNNKINEMKYKKIIENIKLKYNESYNIEDNLEITINCNTIDKLFISSALTALGASCMDGLLLPNNYEEYKDLISLKKVSIENNVPIYLYDETTLTINKEGDKQNESKTKATDIGKCNGSTTCSTNNDKKDTAIQPKTDRTIFQATEGIVQEARVCQFVDGDAEITFTERDGEKTITIFHNGKATKYRI